MILFSTLIREVHHVRGALLLRMTSGAWYRYRGVDERVFLELCSAKSAGRYYNAEVRGRFAAERIANNQRPEELRR